MSVRQRLGGNGNCCGMLLLLLEASPPSPAKEAALSASVRARLMYSASG